MAFSSKRGLFFTVKWPRSGGIGGGRGSWGGVRRSGFLLKIPGGGSLKRRLRGEGPRACLRGNWEKNKHF